MRTSMIASLMALCLFAVTPAGAAESEGGYWVYIGTYTGAKSKGIYSCRFDPKTGEVSEPKLAIESVNPTFLAVHPNHRSLYAANEIGSFRGQKAGAVSAFSIDQQSGALVALNQESSGGGGPCHLTVAPSGRAVLVANYGGGSVASIKLNSDGTLAGMGSFVQHQGSGVNKQRQEAPHGHHITLDASATRALACDLGLDKVMIYRFDASQAELTPNDPPSAELKAGAGPRHLAFHRDGRHAYVINELDSTLSVLSYDAGSGKMTHVQTVSTLPSDFKGNNSTAEVEVHPGGKFVYGSNRGHDSIAVFAVEPGSGRVKLIENEPTQGKTPRNFAIDPTGRYLFAANQATDNVVLFRIDEKTGMLEPAGKSLPAPVPVCVVFVPQAGPR